MHRWYAFYRIRPFGDEWRRTSRLAMSFAAVMGAKVADDAEDKFLPTYNPHREQTEQEMLAEFMKIPGFVFKPKQAE